MSVETISSLKILTDIPKTVHEWIESRKYGIFAFFCSVSMLTVHLSTNKLLNDQSLLQIFFPQLMDPAHNSLMESYSYPRTVQRKPKLILSWSKFEKVFTKYMLPVESLFTDCTTFDCIATLDRSKAKEADAVVFHMPEFRVRDLPAPSQRSPKQMYVFTNFESVGNRYFLPSWKNWNNLDLKTNGFFNLTMSYRLDSDIFFDSYVKYYKPHLMLNFTDTLARKLKSVLWLASHCKTKSHREEYVAELSKYVDVQKFGKCAGLGAKNSCPTMACPKDFISQYKFFLVFENSICRDYVTEKLYWALNNDVVPIVMGGGNYSMFLPPNSYLNVEDYPSPQQLAGHLTFLMENETEYRQLLSWKFPGKILWEQPDVPKHNDSGWCKLCRILHERGKEKVAVVRNVTDWWFRDQCRSITVVDELYAKRNVPFR